MSASSKRQGTLTGGGFLKLVDMPDLTDEEWVERDAKIVADRERMERNEALTEALVRKSILLACGVPKKRLDETMAESFDRERGAVVELSRFELNTTRSIAILGGTVGTGKTLAALDWLFRVGGPSPFFIRASRFETKGRYDEETRHAWEHATAMVLDDLGQEYADSKGNLLSTLDELFDHYSGNAVPLVVTTNLTPPDFEKRYGERVWSRLNQSAHWYRVVGDDLRRTKGRDNGN